MADKIDQLKVGSTSYDIDLPPDAQPSIKSLTVTETITSPQFKHSQVGSASGYLLRADGGYVRPLTLISSGTVSIGTDSTNKKVEIRQVHPWDGVNANKEGIINRYTYSGTQSSTAGRGCIINSKGNDRVQFAIGNLTGLTRTATGNITFQQSFSSTPSVVATFGHASDYSNYSATVRDVTTAGFTYKFQAPSGAASSSACILHWIAVGLYQA